MKAITFLLIMSWIVATRSHASPYLRETGRWPSFQGDSYQMQIAGDLGYVAAGRDGFAVLDLTTTPPRQVGACRFEGLTIDVSVSGTIAYAATQNDGIHRIDVSDPSNPQITATITLPAATFAVAATGSHLFALAGGLRVFSLADPASIRQIAHLPSNSYKDRIALYGGYAFVAAAGLGLEVYDVRNPSVPAFVTSYFGGAVYGMSMVADIVYLAGSAGVDVVDCINPRAPRRRSLFRTEWVAQGVGVDGQTMVSAAEGAGVEVFNQYSPPNRLGIFRQFDQRPISVAVKGSIAYVNYGSAGMQVLNIAEPESPRWDSGYLDDGKARDIEFRIGRGTVAWLKGGLQVLDLSNRNAPRRIAGYADLQPINGVSALGTRIFAAEGWTGSSIGVYTIVNSPSGAYLNPATSFSSQEAEDVTENLSRNEVIIAKGANGIQWVDNTRFASKGSIDTPGQAHEVVVGSGGVVYVADGSRGLRILEAPFNFQSRTIGTIDTPGDSKSLKVSGTKVFLADGEAGVQIIDISDPSAPRILSVIDTPGIALAVALHENRIYIADSTSVQIADISNLESPTLLGSGLQLEEALDVEVEGSTLLVAIGSRGVRLYEILPLVRLEIRLVNANYELKWPSSHVGFRLQYTDEVQPLRWEDHPAVPENVNSEWTVPIHAFDGRRFFRLLKP